jgi:DNA-binding CsgD family transcriptional regulator
MSLAADAPAAAAAVDSAARPHAVFTPVATNASPTSDARYLEQLEHAVSVALSPLDFSNPIAWGDQLTASLCPLAGAVAGAILLPDASPGWRAISHDPVAHSHDAAWGIHEEATERLLEDAIAGDLVLWARDDLADPSKPTRTAHSGTIGIRVRTPSGAVAAVCVHRDRRLGAPPYHLIAALRAIAPAFRAGVAAWMTATALRANVKGMLDSLADPALLFDIAGEPVHENPALGRLTPSVGAARVRSEAQRIAWALGAVVRRRSNTPRSSSRVSGASTPDSPTVRAVRVGSTVYRLRGSVVGEQLLGAEPAVLVTVTTATAEPLTDDALRDAYGLTVREVQVARLIAAGLSNNEIAARLGVRFFTARNHVERTLAKLGVASRHRVGPLLRHEVADAERGRASAA